jgi:hypothetical protein
MRSEWEKLGVVIGLISLIVTMLITPPDRDTLLIIVFIVSMMTLIAIFIVADFSTKDA